MKLLVYRPVFQGFPERLFLTFLKSQEHEMKKSYFVNTLTLDRTSDER